MDPFVNASGSEGLPMSIMEESGHVASAFDTDSGGTSELVHDGVNGAFLSENLTSEEFAMGTQRFFDMPEAALASYRRNAREIWGSVPSKQERLSAAGGVAV